MIPKSRFWHFLGGTVALVIASGFISFGAALGAIEDAIEGTTIQETQEAIEGIRQKAQDSGKEIETLRTKSSALVAEVNTQLDAISTLEQSLASIRSAIERGNPWEKFSTNIKDTAGTQESNSQFEYAVLRNGGFRTLTVSQWNGGWRVMTSPYMTGDAPGPSANPFRLGGSMWIWDTKDPEDDEGVYHYYYYADGGSIRPSGGNGLTGAERGEEGHFYRRLRK